MSERVMMPVRGFGFCCNFVVILLFVSEIERLKLAVHGRPCNREREYYATLQLTAVFSVSSLYLTAFFARPSCRPALQTFPDVKFWLGEAEWAAGAAEGWSRVSGLRVCNAGSLWAVGGGWGT